MRAGFEKSFLFFIAVVAILTAMPGWANKQTTAVVEIGPFMEADGPSHENLIQARIDASEGRTVFRFAPGDYLLSDPRGVRVPSDSTLVMDGARFVLSEDFEADGQAFLLEDAVNVQFLGGEIIGARDIWDPGVNVAGVRVIGKSANIRVDRMYFLDLSSNAVGVFGSEDTPIREVSVTNVTAKNCCNIFLDYLESDQGPAPGSDRRDQGAVAFYYVNEWNVESCRFEGSESDGTHFYQCRNGRFTNNTVADSRMGGYFLEDCENIHASGNLIINNGSRGVTIERNSRFCTLTSNIIQNSGREGLWAPDVSSIVVANNIFIENGRKNDPQRDCEIRLDDGPVYPTPTEHIRIQGNIFHTTEEQTAVIFIGAGVIRSNINAADFADNTFIGPAPPFAQLKPVR